MGILGNFFGGEKWGRGGGGGGGAWGHENYLFLKKQEYKGPLWTHVLHHGIVSG